MKMSRKFITAGVAGVIALGIAVSAWAAEPQITDQKIRSGGRAAFCGAFPGTTDYAGSSYSGGDGAAGGALC